MKKSVKIGVVCLLTSAISPLSSCEAGPTFSAITQFMYSTDAGVSWYETIQEVEVNQTYYMSISMQVVQSKNTDKEITIGSTITIPDTNVVDCYLDDHPGTSITGTVDSNKHITSYEFNLVAGVSPAKFRVIFECVPIVEGKSSVYVTYDDQLSPNWDATGVIKYVKTATVPPSSSPSSSSSSSGV